MNFQVKIYHIVGGVECTNNAKGIWNEESETVELETPVRQTVCIVEFGDGYTISMLTEHGEVVSPVSKVVGRIGETSFEIEEKPGYSLSDAKIVCDNGAEGSISNKVITIINIKQNNTCRVITNPIEIIVTYNVNGGNPLSETSKTVIYTGTYGNLPTPSRTGYTFAGWYTSSSGGSKIEEDTEVTSIVNHTIYAHWTLNKGIFTMSSANCPDLVKNNTSPCYIINQFYNLNSFDGIVTYKDKTYINCKINTYSIGWAGEGEACERSLGSILPEDLGWWDCSSWTGSNCHPYWAYTKNYSNVYAGCTANVTCN